MTLEYKRPDRKRYSNPKVIYLMVVRFHNGITETPVTDSYMRWLQAQGFNVPSEWEAGLQESRLAA